MRFSCKTIALLMLFFIGINHSGIIVHAQSESMDISVKNTLYQVQSNDYIWYYNQYTGHYYAEIDDVRIPFQEAQEYARNLGGYVVSINDLAEDNWLFTLFSEIHPGEIWMGLYRTNGQWIWDSGEPVIYMNINPNGWAGNGTVLDCKNGMGWFERPLQDRLPLIVEMDSPPPKPEPIPVFPPESIRSEWYFYPDNGHYYSIVFDRISWNEAYMNASTTESYLVTLTSKDEEDFVRNLVLDFGFTEFWMGLQETNSWEWITGEISSYINWGRGEPSGDGNYGASRRTGWNDAPNNYLPDCYVIEKSGDLPLPTPTPVIPPELTWHINPNNGHEYTIFPGLKTYEEIMEKASELKGYPVSIGSKNEDDWIVSTFAPYHYRQVYIGLVQDNLEWYWVSGEPVEYVNWKENCPSFSDKYALKYLAYDTYNHQWDGASYWYHLNAPVIFEREQPIHPGPVFHYGMDHDSDFNEIFLVDAPAGFNLGEIQTGYIPAGTGGDSRGTTITLKPGDGIWILLKEAIPVSSILDIHAYLRSTSQQVSLALIALNCPIDGQLGYAQWNHLEIPIQDYKPLHLIYRPPCDKIQAAIFAVNPSYASFSATVWIDNLHVDPFYFDTDNWIQSVPLIVDGSFDTGLENLIVNMNNSDGYVMPFFQSISDVAIRLMLDPSHNAVNIGTSCFDSSGQIPARLFGQVSVQRDSLPGGGMVGYLLTNEYQNLGIFRLADEITDINLDKERMSIGGDFSVHNSTIPISAFVQLGGPNANASIVVDDLKIWRLNGNE